MNPRLSGLLILASVCIALSSGCAVTQPRGEGEMKYVTEPRTGGQYYLYLPRDYVQNDGRHPHYPNTLRWPLIMNFHGMKPYDTAWRQEWEFEQQADIYGFVVCVPELRTNDSFMEYPLTKEHAYVLKDRERVIAIMDHVFATTNADPNRVLSTSWSCGGYLAHYFANRYPDRFSCIATRLSNFSAPLMDERTVPLYKDRMPVGIFIGDGDFPACKSESKEAVAWYMARDFRVVRGKMIDRMGHKRIPQTAAAFFAEQHGIKPLYPIEATQTLAEVQMTEYYPEQTLIAQMSPSAELASKKAVRSPTISPTPRTRITRQQPIDYVNTTAGRNYPFERAPNYLLQSEPGESNAADTKDSSRPASAAGSTRVASAQSTRGGNWLEPVHSGKDGNDRPAQDRADKSSQFAAQSSPTTSGHSKSRGAEVSNASATSNGKASEQSRSDKKSNHTRPFNPSNAGPRDYDLWRRESAGSFASAERSTNNNDNRAESSAGRLSAASSQSRRAKRANVRLTGPAIGTAPHYLQYGVDLPARALLGADCVWKDNGAWMGDQPSGAKILESPGVHKITVLLVTADNEEYRGMATVHVLDPSAATASLTNAR